ncbi:unnamed protein product [Oikopleura dioica]|uniref:Uncharacterized protein n=1 Tax=Oikopleura dioica TaxID=34765 RepID=E4XJ76_OIKDI|nr:unnamed protein product [Oikopleura dioica]
MIFHFLSLTAAVSAQELGTDCNAVRRFVYPDAAECTGVQFCSDDFACDVAADCGSYTCKSASDCREGTTYQVFSPIIDDDGQQTMRVNSLNGYYCANDPPFLCSVDSSGNFYIEATVKNKYPWDGIGTPDNRQLSMISKRKFVANDGAIFKQFGNSSCFGDIIDDENRVRFIKSTDDPNCGKEIEISFVDSTANGLTYVIDFYIGFDDLTKINEFDREVIVRGGVANEFQCRL